MTVKRVNFDLLITEKIEFFFGTCFLPEMHCILNELEMLLI